MRRLSALFLCLLLCALLVFPASADEGDSVEAGASETVDAPDDSAPASADSDNTSEPAAEPVSDVTEPTEDDGSLPGDDVPASDPAVDSDIVSNIPTPQPITDEADFPAIGDYVGYDDLIASYASTIGGGSYVYSDPAIIGYDYAPDAEEGTLLAVLYQLVGKPVVATHYRYTTSNSSGNTAYAVVSLDYDMNFLIGCAMIALFVLCLFKLGGGLLCRK